MERSLPQPGPERGCAQVHCERSFRANCFSRLMFVVLLTTAALAVLGQKVANAWEQPLVANIGHSLTSNGPWSTAAERTVSAGTIIYFRALDANNDPISTYVDKDWVGGQQKNDTANYTWDWNYQTSEGTGNTGTTSGYGPVSKTYNKPGDRVVRLYVYDKDDAGFTDDENKADTVKIKVKLSLETDWMTGASGEWGSCTTAQHAIYPDNLSNRWAAANYTLGIDADHDTNCTHYRFLADDCPDVVAYLDANENQGCHLYLMGGHRYSQNLDLAGYSWRYGQVNALGVVFMFCGAGLIPWQKTAVELHENACWDLSVGAIDYCQSGVACACNESLAGATDAFCADCVAELEAAQDLDN